MQYELLWAPWRSSYVVKNDNDKYCIFCNAVNNDERNNYIVYRSRFSIAMLNRYPYNNGHVMVAPIRHVPSIELLNDEELLDLMKTVSIVMKAVRQCYNPHGFNIGSNIGKAAGAGIEHHVHIHIVPRWIGDTNFMPTIAFSKVIPEDLNSTWNKLRKCIENVTT